MTRQRLCADPWHLLAVLTNSIRARSHFGFGRHVGMPDYKEQKIYSNGYVVGPLTIVGLAAELFWRLAIHDRRGFNV